VLEKFPYYLFYVYSAISEENIWKSNTHILQCSVTDCHKQLWSHPPYSVGTSSKGDHSPPTTADIQRA